MLRFNLLSTDRGGKLEWTGTHTKGVCYVGCTEEEYISMIADEEKKGDVAERFNATVLKTVGV